MFFSGLILFLIFASNLQAEVVNKIVAIVGSEILTLHELESLAEPIYRQFIKPELPEQEKEALKRQIRKEVLDHWIEDTVIGLEAKKHHITITKEEFERFYQAEVARFGGEEKLKTLLKEEGKTLDNYSRSLREQLTKMKFVQVMVGTKIAIPEEELKKLYEEKLKNHDPSTHYELEVLTVKDEKLALQVHQELLKGKTFLDLSKGYPGEITYLKEKFKEEELDPDYLSQIKNLKVEEFTKPIKRDEHFQIIRLLKKRTGERPKFEEIKQELYEEVFQKRAQEYLKKWIKELKETKFIKVYL